MADKYPRTNGWYRVDVTIQHGQVPGDLTDFPVYLDLSLMPAGFWDRVIDGGDIRITKADLTTEVPREVVSCDLVGQTGEVWFMASGTLPSASDTTFVVHFGAAGQSDYAASDTYGANNVWDSNYQMVLHMGDDPDTSTVQDSTANNNDGIKYAAGEPVEVSGALGSAQDFDGSDDIIEYGNTGMGITADITVEVYIKTPSAWYTAANNYPMIISRSSGNSDGWNLSISRPNSPTDTNLRFLAKIGAASLNDGMAIDSDSAMTDTWYYVAGVRDSAALYLYVNGSQKGSDVIATDAIDYGTDPPENIIGWFDVGVSALRHFEGIIDEVRISSVARSGDWLESAHNNLSSPGAFIVCDNLQAPPVTGQHAMALKIGEIVASMAVRQNIGDTPLQFSQDVRAGFGLEAALSVTAGFGLEAALSVTAGFGLEGALSVFPGVGIHEMAVHFVGLGVMDMLIHHAGLGINLVHAVANQISGSTQGSQALLSALAGDPVSGQQSILATLLEKDAVAGYQQVFMAMAGVDAAIYTISAAVYLDGRNISGRVSRVVIRRNRAQVFNDVEISSSDHDLYHMADPSVGRGTGRIEVHVDGDQFNFLLEDRDGSIIDGFTLTGRDITARESDEYAGEIEYSFDGDAKTAGDAAAEMATVSAVDWEAIDWLLPDDFDFTGAPIDGILMLSNEVGAVVRAQSDGSLAVQNKYTRRPVDLPTAEADVSYDQKELMSLRKSNVFAAIYDAVSVSGDQGVEAFVPAMELEESSPERGGIVHVKVFWEGNQNNTVNRYATSGIIRSLGTYEEAIEDEQVDFVNSSGSTQYPVFSLDRTTWWGDDGGAISYVSGKKELSIGSSGQQLFRTGKISYKTRYERLELRGAAVPHLLAAVFLDAAQAAGLLVNVITSDAGDEPEYGEVINTSLINSVPVAKIRGQAWIDDHHYNYQDVTFSAAYDSDAVDGAVCYINDDEIGDRGNYYIMASDIVIDGPKVTNEITARRFS